MAAALGVAAAAAVAVAVARHRTGTGREVPGGILVGDVRAYDSLTHTLLFRALHARVAEDVAQVAPPGARLLELGCGPGRLASLLATRYHLNVTGVDLDPRMVERARANSRQVSPGARSGPAFLVGDAAQLPFADSSFDVVLSTLSMHHWSDTNAGLREIARVLRPGGRALVWDLRAGRAPGHRHAPDLAALGSEGPLRLLSAAPWRWTFGFVMRLQRVELVRR
ncbi:MAG: class I SAM-dependent methyltransferase [Candidatus Dormibacteria bacterium]